MILVCIFVGLALLQIFLSRKNIKWYGLIIPLITFIFATLLSLWNTPASTGLSVLADGKIIEESVQISSTSTLLFLAILILNIPTLIFIVIYFVCRRD